MNLPRKMIRLFMLIKMAHCKLQIEEVGSYGSDLAIITSVMKKEMWRAILPF